MNKIIHRAETRGHVDHGWLNAKHSFSFGTYQDPERMGFGLLRVINDDRIKPSAGFGTHPHNDMEIITIIIEGALRHKDSEGNEGVIKKNEVQVMSAGSGVQHSEFNDSSEEEVNLLQIWVLPEKLSINPRYDQKSFDASDRKNNFQTIISPLDKDGGGLKINQQAYFSMIDLESETEAQYKLKNEKNGVYFFVINGQAEIADESLNTRDAMGVHGSGSIQISSKTESTILVMEIPMQ